MACGSSGARVTGWLFAAMLALSVTPAHALDLDLRLAQLHHTAWTARDGVPENILSLAASHDGVLWIGAAAALWRFDGIAFEKVILDNPIDINTAYSPYALHVARDGALWIGWSSGGVTRLQAGIARHYVEGLPTGTVWAFAEAGDGTLWSAGLGGLAHFDGTRWSRVGEGEGFAGHRGAALANDVDGSLVAWDESGARYRWPVGAERFEPAGGGVELRLPPARTADGTVWVYDQGGVRAVPDLSHAEQPAHPSWVYRSTPSQVSGTLFADRDGGLWFDGPESLHHAARPSMLLSASVPGPAPGVDTFTKADGLSGRYIYTIAGDVEGDVWVATEAGLDRFRSSRFVTVPVQDVAGVAVVTDSGGEIWTYSPNESTLLRQVTATSEVRHSVDLGGVDIVTADNEGTLWVLGRHGVGPFRDGHVAWTPKPTQLQPDAFALAATKPRDGPLWVSFSGDGVFRLQADGWQREVTLPDAGRAVALGAFTDSRNHAWFGFRDRIARVADGTVTTFGAAEGADIGYVTSFVDGRDGLYAGGERGLLWFDGARFVAIRTADPQLLRGIASLIQTQDGALWATTVGAGVLRIPPDELAQARADPGHAMQVHVFDHEDGTVGGLSLHMPRSLALDGHGRLWIGTRGGLVWTMPAAPFRAAPAVAITKLVAGNHDWLLLDAAQATPMRLDSSDRNLRIAWRALALDAPVRTRFRYRLKGRDGDWQDAQSRREVNYAALPPGGYRFEVEAGDEQDKWSGAPVAIEFFIPAYFRETSVFRLLGLAAVLALLWLAHRVRLRQERGRVRALADERLHERERIARELHDTLIQDTQALLLEIHVLSIRLPKPDPLRRDLKAALDRGEAIVGEARKGVWALRDGTSLLLSPLLAQLVQDQSTVNGPALRLDVAGPERPLWSRVARELEAIAKEAVRNALMHARAGEVVISARFSSADITLAIQDDGVGLPPELAAGGTVLGHWGLVGMRERASELGANLEIGVASGGGTRVAVLLSASRANEPKAI